MWHSLQHMWLFTCRKPIRIWIVFYLFVIRHLSLLFFFFSICRHVLRFYIHEFCVYFYPNLKWCTSIYIQQIKRTCEFYIFILQKKNNNNLFCESSLTFFGWLRAPKLAPTLKLMEKVLWRKTVRDSSSVRGAAEFNTTTPALISALWPLPSVPLAFYLQYCLHRLWQRFLIPQKVLLHIDMIASREILISHCTTSQRCSFWNEISWLPRPFEFKWTHCPVARNQCEMIPALWHGALSGRK